MAENDIIHDIEEDMRRQKLRAFWTENGPWIIGGCLGAIVLTAGLSSWRAYKHNQDIAHTAALAEAAATADPEALSLHATGARGEHALFARFKAAALHAARGEHEKAAQIYDAAAQQGGVDRMWKDLARLYAAGQRLETAPAENLRKTLEDLDGTVWKYSAREMHALLHAREGRMREALDILTALAADARTPQGIRARAATLRALYAAEIETAAEQDNG